MNSMDGSVMCVISFIGILGHNTSASAVSPEGAADAWGTEHLFHGAIDLCLIMSIIDIEKCVLRISYLLEKCEVRYALP